MIEIVDVSFNYREKNALSKIAVNIGKGEAVALIGPNGSGKSTLLKLINGIISPSSGEYLFDGTEVTPKLLSDNKFSKLFHKRIGFVFQNSDTQLFCPTVHEEIAFGPLQMGLDEREAEGRVKDCLRLLDIEELEHRAPHNLSEGEKKRVAIASVLALNPEVLVLDEPMNGLDAKSKRFLRELLIRVNENGKTLICSTHDFEYVQGVFKRALVFSKEHEIIRDGIYDEIINNYEYLVEHNIK